MKLRYSHVILFIFLIRNSFTLKKHEILRKNAKPTRQKREITTKWIANLLGLTRSIHNCPK